MAGAPGRAACHEELVGNAVEAKERVVLLRALAEDTTGIDAAAEAELRQERELSAT